MRRFFPVLPVLLLSVILSVVGCNNDTVGPTPVVPTIDNIWPHEDGRSWTYDFTQQSFDDPSLALFPDSASVPPPPDPADVDSILAALPAINPTTHHGIWRLKFDGQITTESGAQGQNLDESLFTELDGGLVNVVFTDHGPQRLLHALLRDRSQQAPRKMPSDVEPPILLFGYAFEQTPDHIGTYGDVDQDLAWKFLDDQLQVAHRFDFQLVPSLADNVFLHVLVAESMSVSTEVGEFSNALRVVYVVDNGIFRITDESGATSGYFRPLVFGEIVYVPQVGPVQSFERVILGPDFATGNLGLVIDRFCNLIGTGLDGGLTP